MGDSVMIKKFKELRLSPYETKSYLSLLEKDTLTVTEVARLAGIPRANAYEALEKLLTKGFCVSRPGKIRKYSAVDPASLEKKAVEVLDESFEGKLNKLYEQQDAMLAEKKAARESVANLITELNPLYKNSRSNENPLEYIEIIKDSFQIHKKFMELVGETKEEMLNFVKPPYVGNRKMQEEQVRQQADLCENRIIEIRAIQEIPQTKEEIQYNLEYLLRYSKGSDETRVIKELPMKMAIFDEKIVMLPLKDPVSSVNSLTTQVVEHPDLAKSLKMLFYHLWEQAEDFRVLEDFLKKDLLKIK